MLSSWLSKLYLTYERHSLYILGIVLTTKDLSLFYLNLRTDIHCISTSLSLNAVLARKEEKDIHSSMEKIDLSQYKGDMIPFSIGYNLKKKCKTCWLQRKQGCQNNHARLLAWPFIFFFLLFSSSKQPKLVRRMAQNIKTYFAMRKTILVLVFWRKQGKSFKILMARGMIDPIPWFINKYWHHLTF